MSQASLSQVTNEIVGQSTESPPRLRVVLDLDDTLVHSLQTKPKWESRYEIRKIKCFWENKKQSVWMIMRPKLNETLELLSQHADLYIYSAAADVYVEAAVKSIDPASKFFKKIFAYSHLVHFIDDDQAVRGGNTKDIRIIEPDFLEARTVLIDDEKCNFYHKPQNGLHLHGFYGDIPGRFKVSPAEGDDDLYNLAKLIVEKLVPAPDIRPLIQNYKITIPKEDKNASITAN